MTYYMAFVSYMLKRFKGLNFILYYNRKVQDVKKFNLHKYKIFRNKIEKISQIAQNYCMILQNGYNGKQEKTVHL